MTIQYGVPFRHDSSGAPTDIKVVDLQLSRRARPSIDLAYCFASSLTPEMREKHTDELLEFYHKELVKFLLKLGYTEDLYPFKQLKEDYVECFTFAFVLAVMHAQVRKDENEIIGSY